MRTVGGTVTGLLIAASAVAVIFGAARLLKPGKPDLHLLYATGRERVSDVEELDGDAEGRQSGRHAGLDRDREDPRIAALGRGSLFRAAGV